MNEYNPNKGPAVKYKKPSITIAAGRDYFPTRCLETEDEVEALMGTLWYHLDVAGVFMFCKMSEDRNYWWEMINLGGENTGVSFMWDNYTEDDFEEIMPALKYFYMCRDAVTIKP